MNSVTENTQKNSNARIQQNSHSTKPKVIMSYSNAVKTGLKNHLIMDFCGGQNMKKDDVIEVNGIKLTHIPKTPVFNDKATMELNMLLFGKQTENNDDVIVNSVTLTPHEPIQELNLELEDESPFKIIENPTENWGDEDDLSPFGNMTPIYSDHSSPLHKTDSINNNPYPITPPLKRKDPDWICIDIVLDDTKPKIFQCKDCNLYHNYTELRFFEHCCSNIHLDNVEQRLLKEINPPLSCILMKSDNLYLDDVEQEYDMWKKSENNHNNNIEKDNNKTKNICSYCKAFKLPFHNTHSYSQCPYNKTTVDKHIYTNRFSPLQKIDKNQKIVL
tara:strand:+ start:881 stop:1873 length:993 start_codon:yes stop_codon:yes gene_type:complete